VAVARSRLAGLDVRLQLVLLRSLGVAALGLGLLLGLDGIEDVLAVARGAAAAVALLIGLAALCGFAASGAVGLHDRPRGSIAAWSLLTLVLVGAAGVAGLRALDFSDRLVWSLSGGVALGLAVAARVALALEERAPPSHAAGAPDVYRAYVRGRRASARQETVRAWLVEGRIVAVVLELGLVGLAALAAVRLAAELTDSVAILLPLLLVAVPATGVALFFAAVLATLPLGLFLPSASCGLARRGLARASGVQPLPDALASAVVSAVTVLSARRRRPASDR
jgi:hypothetical protein